MAKTSRKKRVKKATIKKRKKPRVKRTKRKITKKGRTTKVKYESVKEIRVEKALVDNFIGLQKVMVNLSSKFDNLSNQISKLLNLFEISAKSLAQRDVDMGKENKDAKRIIEKLDHISQHAGLIGKGLALIHEHGFETEFPEEVQTKPHSPAQPVKTPQKPVMPTKKQDMQGYQKSISPDVSKENAYDVDKSAKPFSKENAYDVTK